MTNKAIERYEAALTACVTGSAALRNLTKLEQQKYRDTEVSINKQLHNGEISTTDADAALSAAMEQFVSTRSGYAQVVAHLEESVERARDAIFNLEGAGVRPKL